MKKRIAIAALMALVGIGGDAWALKVPRPVSTDSRIRTVVYYPKEVYKFIGHYGYQSSIEFGQGEEIETISVGDSVAWQIIPSGNRIFLKPVEQDATTNMTVVSNKHTYHFELHALETEDIRDEDMIFVLQFVYPEQGGAGVNTFTAEIPIPDLSDPEKYNFKYSLAGPEHIAPVRVFDDGEFTYLQFRGRNTEVPAIFMVDSEGRESLVNYRARENWIIIERVASRFTLRHGADVVCLYNDAMPMTIKPVAQKK